MIEISESLFSIKDKIPKNSKIILYVRLKNLQNNDLDYKKQSEHLLDMVRKFLSPCEIYVPTFTYSFTDTFNFDVNTTPSEVGRFSEEIRKFFLKKKYRTLDPVFSVIETENGFFKNNKFNKNAFGKSSIWKYLNDKSHYIININLNVPIIATQLHYLEYHAKVGYRYNKCFSGKVKGWDNIQQELTYKYYVRDLKANPVWDRHKILKICQDNKLVIESEKIKVFEWLKLFNFLKKKLTNNSQYLLK